MYDRCRTHLSHVKQDLKNFILVAGNPGSSIRWQELGETPFAEAHNPTHKYSYSYNHAPRGWWNRLTTHMYL